MLQLQLIQLYYYVCHCYDKYVCLHFQRQSSNFSPQFTDQEVLTMDIFGIFQKRFTVKDGYYYMKNHWLDWFPAMPSYQAYNYPLNQLYWQFEVIIGELMTQMPYRDCYADISLTDSLPIILSKRPYQAKRTTGFMLGSAVALQAADKGYCSTKDLYYHGIKFHFLGFDTYKHLPTPEYMYFTAASANDLTSLKTILPALRARKVIGDKIFACTPLNRDLLARDVEISCNS